MAERFGAFENSVGIRRRSWSPIGTVHLHAKVAIGAARIVAGRQDDSAYGVFAADQVGCRRSGEDAAGGDDYFPQPMGGCHAQDHIDGTNVAVTTVATHHQGAAISTRQGAKCGFDEAFEVVRLFKLLAAFAQARGAGFLIGEWAVEMNLT